MIARASWRHTTLCPNRTGERFRRLPKKCLGTCPVSFRRRRAVSRRSDRGIPIKGGPRRVEPPHLVARDQKVDRGTKARRRWGSESIPGRPPKRSGPSRTTRPGVGCGLGAEARRDLRRDRMWRRLRGDRSRVRLVSSLNRSEERVSRAASLSPVSEGLRRSATRAAPKGPTIQRWPGQLCFGGHCKQAGSETVQEGGATRIRSVRQALVPRRRSGVPLA